jgi:hypothetical protein
MTKANKIQAASDIAATMVADLMESIAPVTAKAPKAKAVKVEKAENEVGLTVREIAIMKAVAASEFVDPVSGAVPSFTIAIDSEVPVGTNKVNSPIPGIVASLNKKGMFTTSKVKGQTVVVITSMGKEFLEAAQ